MCRYSLFLAAGAKISWIDQQPDVDPSGDKINGKIQLGEQIKLPTTFVIGKRDMDAGTVRVYIHGKDNLRCQAPAEAIAGIVRSIKDAAGLIVSWSGRSHSGSGFAGQRRAALVNAQT
jgi:hypothetical protein